MNVRPRAIRVLCAIVLIVAFGLGGGPAAADCAAPEARFSPRIASPGDTIFVEGDYWATECNDTVVCSNGCFRDACTGGEPAPRAQSIAIEVRGDDGSPITLVEGLAAGEDYGFGLDVPLPRDLSPGVYELQVVDVDAGIEGYLARDRLVVRDVTSS